MRKYFIAAGLAVFALAFLYTQANASDIVRRVFDNGLTAIVKEDHTKPVVAIRVYVRAGSIYEGEYLGAGTSHFLEHMLFESTDEMSKDEIEEARERMGGITNAYTWKDHTCYHTQVRSEHTVEALELMHRGVCHALMPQPEFDTQRDIILNEMRMGRDEPTRILQKAFFSTMYIEHPVRYPTIGYEGLFKGISREELVDYYHTLYIPERIVVVVVGDISAVDTLAIIGETFGTEPRGTPPAISLPEEPPQLGAREIVKEMDIEAAYMRIGFRTTYVGVADAYALDVLATVLGEGLSARLKRKIRDELGLVTGISAYSATPRAYPGYFVVYVECKPSNLTAAREAIIDELFSLREKKVSDEELERAKKQLEAYNVLGKQTVEDQADILGSFELETGNAEFAEVYLDGIRSVTAEETRDVAAKYFTEDNMTIAVVAPKGTLVTMAETGVGVADRPMRETQLDNGLTLLVKENPAVEAVSVNVIVNGGGRVVPDGKEGLADVVAGMLLKGTKKRDAREIAEDMENLGAGIFSNASRDYISLGAEMLADDFDEGLEVVLDCLRNSKFPEDEFGKLRDRYRSFVISEDDDWEVEAVKVLRSYLYPSHPYGTLVGGTPETLESLTRDDVVDYYDTVVVPENVIVSIVGDVDEAYVTRKLIKEFSGWKPGGTVLAVPAVDPAPAAVETVEYATDKEQSVVYVGFYGPIYDEDRYALDLIDSILSGIYLPGGRLHASLRGAGLVYVVHAYVARAMDPGFFGIYAACEPKNRDKVLAIIDEE
ncbi:MAG: insulinase family protein [Candidatus Coatesbacteria bacterium]|nr:MAG: insulinase family protein [Candidatus Coatesbacteria bacterium]